MNREAILAAIRAIPEEDGYVWDGADEDDRPLTPEEMRQGHERYLKRQAQHMDTEKVSISADIVAAFRATGENWQQRMNQVLSDYLAQHIR